MIERCGRRWRRGCGLLVARRERNVDLAVRVVSGAGRRPVGGRLQQDVDLLELVDIDTRGRKNLSEQVERRRGGTGEPHGVHHRPLAVLRRSGRCCAPRPHRLCRRGDDGRPPGRIRGGLEQRVELVAADARPTDHHHRLPGARLAEPACRGERRDSGRPPLVLTPHAPVAELEDEGIDVGGTPHPFEPFELGAEPDEHHVELARRTRGRELECHCPDDALAVGGRAADDECPEGLEVDQDVRVIGSTRGDEKRCGRRHQPSGEGPETSVDERPLDDERAPVLHEGGRDRSRQVLQIDDQFEHVGEHPDSPHERRNPVAPRGGQCPERLVDDDAGRRAVAHPQPSLELPADPVRQRDERALPAVTLLDPAQAVDQVSDAGADDATAERNDRHLSCRKVRHLSCRNTRDLRDRGGRYPPEWGWCLPEPSDGCLLGRIGRLDTRQRENPTGPDPVLAVQRSAIRLQCPVVEHRDLPPTSRCAQSIRGDRPEGLTRSDRMDEEWLAVGLRRVSGIAHRRRVDRVHPDSAEVTSGP